MTSKNFNIYSKYYDLLYNDKDYNAEVNYVIKRLKSYSPNAKSILEFGSGTGKHGLLFQKKGYSIFGLERSEKMVAEAQQKGFNCQISDISNFTLDTKYDSIISLFHVIGYLTSNTSLINTFNNANRHLNKNGVFLFDVWYSPAVYSQKPLTRVKKIQSDEIDITRIAVPKIDINGNIVDVQYTIFAKEINSGIVTELFESHPVRHFSIPEIGLLAELTGFEVLRTEEFLTEKEPSNDTWGVCFILKKK